MPRTIGALLSQLTKLLQLLVGIMFGESLLQVLQLVLAECREGRAIKELESGRPLLGAPLVARALARHAGAGDVELIECVVRL